MLAQQSVSIIELINIESNFLNAGFLASLYWRNKTGF